MLRCVLGIFLCCKGALQRTCFGLLAIKLGLEFVPYPCFDCGKVQVDSNRTEGGGLGLQEGGPAPTAAETLLVSGASARIRTDSGGCLAVLAG